MHNSKCPWTHEAQALELFNQALARAMAAPAAHQPAAMTHALVFAGCSRLAAEAMNSAAAAGLPEPQGLAGMLMGLRLAEPIVVRLAQSNVTPRMVEEVLALWVREAAGGGPADAGSVFSERPTLERLLFSGDMRAGLRGAPPMASSVFRRAVASMLDYMRADPGDVVAEDRKALCACVRVEQRAHYAREQAMAAAAATATGDADAGGQRREAARAAREAKQAFEAAASLVNAALVARDDRAMEPPLDAGEFQLCLPSRRACAMCLCIPECFCPS